MAYFDNEKGFPITVDDFASDYGMSVKKKYIWRFPIVFGALKHHWRCFWTTEDIEEINEYYHEYLIAKNGFPVKALDLFRSKKDPNSKIKNTFFVDCSSDPYFFIKIISGIRWNHKQLSKIIDFCMNDEFDNNVDAYFANVSEYMKNEKKKGHLKAVPSSYYRSNFNKYYQKDNDADKKVYQEACYSIDYRDIYFDGRTMTIIQVDNSKLEPVEGEVVQLLPSSISLLRNRLSGIENADLETCQNLLDNYEYYVEKNRVDEFKKDLEKGSLQLNSVFEEATIDFIVNLIKKYYSPLAIQNLSDAKIKEERSRIINDFKIQFRTSEKWENPARVCFLIDILGYCYKKGYSFLGKEAYIRLNAVMRYLVENSISYWYCFDPLLCGEWKVAFEYGYIDDDNQKEVCDVLKAIIEQNINFKSSLLLDVLKIAAKETIFNKAKKLVREAIIIHKSNKKKRVIYF